MSPRTYPERRKPIPVRLSTEQLQRLDTLAAGRGGTRSDEIRRAVNLLVNQPECNGCGHPFSVHFASSPGIGGYIDALCQAEGCDCVGGFSERNTREMI